MLSKTTMLYENRIKGTETNIGSLPDELLFDILVRLPADLLHYIARLVCRKWFHIIRSDGFINTHFQQYSTYGLVLSFFGYKHPHSVYVTAPQGRIETSELCYMRRARLMASCNGLALELNPLSLRVKNPATKQSLLLPSVSTRDKHVYRHQSCIAYSAASMEYKVTLPYKTVGDGLLARLDIMTVGVDKSWRRVEIPRLLKDFTSFFCLFSPLSSEGFLHWGSGKYCLTLNVENEMITMSKVPIPRHSCYYLSTGRHLTMLASCRGEFLWEVWEMRPAESGDQWRKVLPDIDLEDKKCSLQQQYASGDDKLLVPVGWVKYPEVLALCFPALGCSCIFYNLETREIDTIDLPHEPCSNYRAFVHMNSLVWLSQD